MKKRILAMMLAICMAVPVAAIGEDIPDAEEVEFIEELVEDDDFDMSFDEEEDFFEASDDHVNAWHSVEDAIEDAVPERMDMLSEEFGMIPAKLLWLAGKTEAEIEAMDDAEFDGLRAYIAGEIALRSADDDDDDEIIEEAFSVEEWVRAHANEFFPSMEEYSGPVCETGCMLPGADLHFIDTGTQATSAFVDTDAAWLVVGERTDLRLTVTGFTPVHYMYNVYRQDLSSNQSVSYSVYPAPLLSLDGNIAFTPNESGRYYFHLYAYDEEGHYIYVVSSPLETIDLQLESKIDQILSGITEDMSDYDKAKYLHDWIVNNTTYADEALPDDYVQLPGMPVQHITGVLLNGRAVCQGYSETFQLLLTKCGIESQIVVTLLGNHAWNLVRIDGRYYHVDCTWDDLGDGMPVSYQYFMKTDEQLKELAAGENPKVHFWNADDTALPGTNRSEFVPTTDVLSFSNVQELIALKNELRKYNRGFTLIYTGTDSADMTDIVADTVNGWIEEGMFGERAVNADVEHTVYTNADVYAVVIRSSGAVVLDRQLTQEFLYANLNTSVTNFAIADSIPAGVVTVPVSIDGRAVGYVSGAALYVAPKTAGDKLFAPESCDALFMNCSDLRSVSLVGLDMSRTTNIQCLFANCSNLAQIDLTGVVTGKLRVCRAAFGNTAITSIDVSGFDTELVQSLNQMFAGCSNLQRVDLSNWQTGNVTDFSQMFFGCQRLQTLNMKNAVIDPSAAVTQAFHCAGNQKLFVCMPQGSFDLVKDTYYGRGIELHAAGDAVRENERASTCSEEGSYESVIYCSECGEEISREQRTIEKTAHTAAEAVRENEKASTCSAEGSYESVVYCADCHAEISRVEKAIAKTAHTPAEAVRENEKVPTCSAEGSYESVVYCAACDAEISRTEKTIAKIAHTPAEAVRENEQAATCTAEGSYESVVYCDACGKELSREQGMIAKTAHTPADPVAENVQNATCTVPGSYESVVYCADCHTELTREYVTGAFAPHIPAEAVRENEKASTCTAEGSYESVVYCSECGEEISREQCTIEKTAHTPAEAVRENERASTCSAEGSYESVVYCADCHAEMSRVEKAIAKTAHTPAEAVRENEKAATCTAEGSYESVVYCAGCHAEMSRVEKTIAKAEHTPLAAIRENEKAPTCAAVGTYDSVVYCAVCDHEMSREQGTIEKIAHTPAEAVRENEQAATCTAEGSYESVVYCDACGEELSREQGTIAKTAHTPADPVAENVQNATCTVSGSYDSVVYCADCHTELAREYVTGALAPHIPAEAVRENEKAPTCTAEGSYESVVYCSECGAEISRERRTIEKTAHTAAEAVRENERASTCSAEGSYESVVYCTDCHAEMSRVEKAIAKTAHTPAEAVRENEKAATCTAEGSYESVVYCADCDAEISRMEKTIAKTAHTPAEAVRENEKAPTCSTEGSCDSVIYCTECGAEITRTKEPVAKIAHDPAEAVRENEVPASCTAEGSYEAVIYCSECGTEISRGTETIAKTAHTPAAAVAENVQGATCTVPGSYESVVYCADCGIELSRSDVTGALAPHTPGEAVRKNEVPATCTAEGSYDSVVYCTECGAEIECTACIIEKTKHIPGDMISEIVKPATCTESGKCDYVKYCKVCGTEIYRGTGILGTIPHTPGDPVRTDVVNATCTAEGSCNLVTYCTVCGEITDFSKATIEKVPHTPGMPVETIVPATCIAEGSRTVTVSCMVCDAVLESETETIEKTGHRSEPGVDTAPTSVTPGRSGDIRCADCGTLISAGEVSESPLGVYADGKIIMGVKEVFTPDIIGDEAKIFTSSKKAYVTVAEDGTLTAKKAGTSVITVLPADGESFEPQKVTVVVKAAAKKVTVSPTKAYLDIEGKPMQLTAKVTGSYQLKWMSSDESIVTVSADGMISPAGVGTANITVTTFNGKKAVCKVTVYDTPAGFETDREKIGIVKGKTAQLKPVILPEAADPALTWTSSDPAIAAVSDAGKVTAKGVGECTVSAVTVNGLTYTCSVKVTAVPTGVVLSESKHILAAGEVFSLSAVVNPAAAAQNVVWTSSNKKAATVENGVVTGIAPGTAKITAKTPNGKSKVCTVTVKAAPTIVTVIYPAVGEGMTVNAKLQFASSGEYSSEAAFEMISGSEFADVDPVSGALTAKAAGTAVVRCTVFGGISSEKEVVIAPAPSVLTLNKESVTLAKSKSFTLLVAADEGTVGQYSYQSADSAIAAVNDAGKITAKKKGTTIITVTDQTGRVSAQCVVTVK